ncbi:GFA family protein [Methylomonas sp. YC3]
MRSGSIRSEIRAASVFLCQCRQCQRITGTGHSAEFVASAKDTIRMGAPKFSDPDQQAQRVFSVNLTDGANA